MARPSTRNFNSIVSHRTPPTLNKKGGLVYSFCMSRSELQWEYSGVQVDVN